MRGRSCALPDRIAVNDSSTSGSSGVPVKFFASAMNARYNHVRSIAEYFLEERDLKLNRVQIDFSPHLDKGALKVTRSEAWLGALSSFFGCGSNKVIEYFEPDMKRFREELERDPIGYLVTAQWTLQTVLQSVDPDTLKRAGLRMWISVADAVDPGLREALASQGIPVRSTYSAQEVGPIGFECQHIPGNYHVATSNVIVEVELRPILPAGPAQARPRSDYAPAFIRNSVHSLRYRRPCCPFSPNVRVAIGVRRSQMFMAAGKIC